MPSPRSVNIRLWAQSPAHTHIIFNIIHINHIFNMWLYDNVHIYQYLTKMW